MKLWNGLLKLVLFVFITRYFMSNIYGSSIRLLFSLLVLAGIFSSFFSRRNGSEIGLWENKEAVR